MKKALSIILAVAMLLALVVGCGGGDEKDPGSSTDSSTTSTPEGNEGNEGGSAAGKRIAVCMGSINHPVHRIVQMGFMTMGEELGMAPEISGLDEGSMQELMAKWESSVSNGVEGILAWVGDDSAYEFLKTVKGMDCYVTVPHFPHSYQDTKDFIDRNLSCLPDAYGREAAKFVVERLEAKGVTEGSIGITQNGPNITENAANDGFRSQMLDLGTKFTIADTVYEGAEVAEAATKVTSVIQSNADIVAGFGTTGASPQSWATAMENTGKTDLVVVGMDYTELNVNLVKEGKITAIVCQPLYVEAQECVKTLKELFEGKTFTGSESEWFVELDAPLAYIDGEGTSDINSYDEIIKKVVEYFK